MDSPHHNLCPGTQEGFDGSSSEVRPRNVQLILKDLSLQHRCVLNLKLRKLGGWPLDGTITQSQESSLDQNWFGCRSANGWKAHRSHVCKMPKALRNLRVDQQAQGSSTDVLSILNERLRFLIANPCASLPTALKASWGRAFPSSSTKVPEISCKLAGSMGGKVPPLPLGAFLDLALGMCPSVWLVGQYAGEVHVP